ncbi:replication initiation membrane attachment protein [Levilactobacillus senmaizukei DSM 21775 = NBRC 103853]|uniref:Replication initiation membrane attachment protein n=1 Tax=Levilactobacillus senmaizukei DSM 21775 = NBRC 103853 TaxID=1423803 RepID=A0A0R2DMW6_9LACO|nr:DnaD domain protein [Levilactobacillus senmaizukei]KRN01596.1 replication initiation membrane attachment protein [Levilactobacillus senmaizukei DSM 21775 = NBRC 103853]
MEDSWHQLQPKTGFVVRLTDRLTDESWQTLTQLYQPVIGPSAAGLFSALFWLPKRSTYKRHATLLALLGMDLAHLYAARTRLEAAGLLTTMVKTTDGLTSFVYELHAPLLPVEFFKDDLLSVQLLGAVGETFYQMLVATCTPQPVIAQDEQDITKNFLEVFHVDGQELSDLPAAITTGREQLPAAKAAPEVTATDDFDFKLLGDILTHSFVDTQALRGQRQLIMTEHTTYGIDEVTMARYIGEAVDLATNQFDAEQFKRVIAKSFGRPTPVSAEPAPVASATNATIKGNSAEQALVKVASTTAPAVFLQAIKQKNGGFVTDGEQRIIRDLVSRQLFPSVVLNLMIYHVLVDEDRPTLNKNLLDTIANDWSKANVNSAAAAIDKIRERQRTARQPRRSSKRGVTVKETLPEWAKKPSTPAKGTKPVEQAPKLSAEQQAKLAERIAKLKARSNTGKED